jgi:hypothetical protein
MLYFLFYDISSLITGDLKRGRFHGKGQLTGPDDKFVYNGDFEDGQMHGNGLLSNSQGKYEGMINFRMTRFKQRSDV